MPLHGRILHALPTALIQGAVTALRQGTAHLPWRPPAELRRDLAASREADDLGRSAVSAHIKAKALNGTYGERIQRRAVSEQERGMPQRLREDLRQALDLPDAAAQRASVDRIVQGITDGTYGSAFQRRAVDAAMGAHPHDSG